MSFLDKLEQMSNKEKKTNININPLTNKPLMSNPFLDKIKQKKQELNNTEKVEEKVEEVVENKEPQEKEIKETAKEVIEEKVVNTSEETEKEEVKEVKEKDLSIEKKDETIEEKDNNKNEDAVKAPRKKRGRKKSEDTTKVNTLSAPNNLHAYEYANLDIFGMKISFEEANAIVLSKFVDDKWIEFRDNINKKINNIKINRDINPSVINILLEELNTLNDEIASPLEDAKCLISILSDKESGIGTVIKTISSVEDGGTNATARQAAGFKSLMNVELGNEKLNLVLMLMAAKVRYSFLESIKNRIEFKYNTLITVSGSLKIAAGLCK